jgi:transcriptional regulator with XRE-family HTH domain
MADDKDRALIEDTAKRLRDARCAKGLTQAEVANGAGLGESHYAQIERGEKNPITSNFRKIVKAIGITYKELFGEK